MVSSDSVNLSPLGSYCVSSRSAKPLRGHASPDRFGFPTHSIGKHLLTISHRRRQPVPPDKKRSEVVVSAPTRLVHSAEEGRGGAPPAVWRDQERLLTGNDF